MNKIKVILALVLLPAALLAVACRAIISDPEATPQVSERIIATASSDQTQPTDSSSTQIPGTNLPMQETPKPSAALPDDLEDVPGLQDQALLEGDELQQKPVRTWPSYAIQFDLGADLQSYNGSLQLEFTNTEDTSLDSLYFRLLPNGGESYGNGSLTVSDVTVNDQPAEVRLSVDDSVLEVQLASVSKPGEETTISMTFSGQVPLDFGGSGYGIFNYSERDQTLVLTGWYPMLAVYDDEGWNLDPVTGIGDAVYADMAFYRIDVRYPEEQVLVSTGSEVEQEDSGDTRAATLVSGPVREFLLAFSPEFKVVSGTVDGITVNSYTYPGEERAAQVILDDTLAALQVFNDTFGPYPYTEFDVIQAPLSYAIGVEFPGVILLADGLYISPSRPMVTFVVAHEVAHQWWYNLVGNDVYDDPWLDEALTNYSAAYFMEESLGASAYQQIIDGFQDDANRLSGSQRAMSIAEPLEAFESIDGGGTYSAVVYSKGALFFHSVRERIGDENFFEALRRYYTENKYEIAEPEDILNIFETTAGIQLDDFYQEWFGVGGLP